MCSQLPRPVDAAEAGRAAELLPAPSPRGAHATDAPGPAAAALRACRGRPLLPPRAQKSKKLPPTWKYESSTASTLVA